MKYNPVNLNSLLFEEDYIPIKMEDNENSTNITLKYSKKVGVCPYCHEEATKLHATYHRHVQGVPFRLKPLKLDIISYKFTCENEECKCQVFAGDLPNVSRSQRRTDELNQIILALVPFISNEGISKIMKELGVSVSNDSIQRLIDRIEFVDNEDVEKVGIDDVAIRKGQTYATAVYDMEDHHLIALLDGRDGETLKQWLKNHKKIKIAARDRASAYAIAINQILPDCMQVADRFHLLQNLSEHLKDVLYDNLPKNIFIENGKVIEEPEKVEEPYDKKRLEGMDYDDTAPVDENGNIIEYDAKRRDLDNKNYRKYAKNRKKNRN